MTIVTFILRDNNIKQLDVESGINLMEVAVLNNIRGIDGECGGCCSCGTCHVYVEGVDGDLPEPGEAERGLLSGIAVNIRDNSRLACQVAADAALHGLTVRAAERQT